MRPFPLEPRELRAFTFADLDLPPREAVRPDREFDFDRAEAELFEAAPFFDLDFGAPLAESIVVTETRRAIARRVERALARASNTAVIILPSYR